MTGPSPPPPRESMLKRPLRIVGGILLVLTLVPGALALLLWHATTNDPIEHLYVDNCSVCHGLDLEGAAQGPALAGAPLVHGDSVPKLIESIRDGSPARGMPAWNDVLGDDEIKSIALYVAERRDGQHFLDMKNDAPLVVPDGVFTSEEHAFRLEVVASALTPLPFSIAPLPNGDILMTEKTGDLVVVHPGGDLTRVKNAPHGYEAGLALVSLPLGVGSLLDVDLHPDYETNGWVYLHFTERCEDCGAQLLPTSMNKLVRGRIRDGVWLDEETLWQPDRDTYTITPDLGAGGRLAFDPSGYVFMSLGIKGRSNFDGVQDLGMPYGKILRLHDDGRVPADNPFVDTRGALPEIWTYGHRSPQGLEFEIGTGRLWGAEMGPRGGDEINLLRPGRNYGWPLYSLGQDYDGTPVEYGELLGIEFDLDDIEQPIVDITPSPATSSFVIYEGEAFPAWGDAFLVGSLKGSDLFRVLIEEDRHVRTETLIHDLARIRDIEVDVDGTVLLLLEHASGGQIVRMVPVDR